MVRPEDTDGAFGMSFLVGVGLGVSYRAGSLERWGPCEADVAAATGCNSQTDYALKRYLDGLPSDEAKEGIPRVLPMVDVLTALRFTFGERFVFRAEGGLHTTLYYGGSLGIQF